jgi:hypothetical protein
MNKKISAGWGEADITPEGKTVALAGQYYQRIAQGIHSRLKTVALVIEQDGESTVMISLDVVNFPEDFSRRLQQAVANRIPEISPNRVIINAIHTHNAPGLSMIFRWGKHIPDAISGEEYRDLVEEKVLDAVQHAWNSRCPSGIANTLESARVGHCRRAVYSNGTAEMYGKTDREDFLGMEGGEDSGVDLLFFFNENKKPAGTIVNIACPSQVMEATYMVSSDFMGALRDKLKAEFGSDFKTMCQISAAGCQAPRDLTRNYKSEPDFWHADGVDVISQRLLEAVRNGFSKAIADIEFEPELKHSVREIQLPRRRASYMEYLEARSKMAHLEDLQDSDTAYNEFCELTNKNEKIDGPGPYDSKLHHFVKIRNNEAVIWRYEEQDKQPNFAVELHVVKLGNVAFTTNPFELYLDFGHQIKARSQAEQTFLIQLANGSGGYLPSARAEQLGGYGGLIINGQVGSDGGKMLVDKTVMEIEKLWK